MRHNVVRWTCLALLLGAPATGAPGQDISTEQVRKAIDQGVAFLKSRQRADGSWPDWLNQPGGVTSLCTMALLNSGVPVSDDSVQRALSYLRKLRPEKINMTYSVALQTMVFCQAEPKRDLAAIGRNVDWLENAQIAEGPTRGSWAYPGDYGARGDNSNTQFAMLALYEAERVGRSAESRLWRLAKAYWEGCQNADGSWGYRRGMPGTGSMTCAGISSLVMASDMVRQADAVVAGEQIQCCQRAEADNDRLRRAMEWLGTNFAVTRNPGASRQAWLLYYLYGLERVGRLTAQRVIGCHD